VHRNDWGDRSRWFDNRLLNLFLLLHRWLWFNHFFLRLRLFFFFLHREFFRFMNFRLFLCWLRNFFHHRCRLNWLLHMLRISGSFFSCFLSPNTGGNPSCC
jgi:hypothetical protein